jgi:hypothetical protein
MGKDTAKSAKIGLLKKGKQQQIDKDDIVEIVKRV